jgi:hypothetical protein
MALRILGQIQGAQGRREHAHHSLSQSMEMLQQHGSPYQVARAQWAMARLLAADASLFEQTTSFIESAQATFHRLGARSDLDTLNAWLQELPSASSTF